MPTLSDLLPDCDQHRPPDTEFHQMAYHSHHNLIVLSLIHLKNLGIDHQFGAHVTCLYISHFGAVASSSSYIQSTHASITTSVVSFMHHGLLFDYSRPSRRRT